MIGDIVFSFYLGASQTAPSDLHVVQTVRGNDATMHDVPWNAYPFRFEPYYGMRLSYNAHGHPETRIVLDYTHYKIYEPAEDVVVQTGTWHGVPLNVTAPLNQRVQSFEMTHGLNMIGLSLLQNLSQSRDGVYIGIGPTFYLPHSENRVDGIAGGNVFAFGGFGFQAHAGVRGCLGNVPLFAELKYNEGYPTVPIADGTAQTTLHTVHELGGIDFGPACARKK